MNFSQRQKLIDRRGYTLLELVITLGVLSILVMGTLPVADNAVKRQKEAKLRDALRQMRLAIDEFKRDTLGACSGLQTTSSNKTAASNSGVPSDPRSRVVIDDCKIFDSDNLDRYPPDLDTLVDGVRVKPRAVDLRGTSAFGENATEINESTDLTKVYLREIPVDPFTGEKDWKLRSSYQDKDSENWDEINVFDVRSAATGEALNGEKYSDW